MSDISVSAASAREQARQTNGKFGHQEHAETGDLDLAAGRPSPAETNFEAEGLEALIEDYREKLEWPEREHYADEDVAAIEEKLAQMEARLAYLRPTPATPTFNDACQQYFAARDAAGAAAVAEARSIVKEHYPTAKYLQLECSDQGENAGMCPLSVYDANGKLIAEIDWDSDCYDGLQAATAWLDQEKDTWDDARYDPSVPKAIEEKGSIEDGFLEIR